VTQRADEEPTSNTHELSLGPDTGIRVRVIEVPAAGGVPQQGHGQHGELAAGPDRLPAVGPAASRVVDSAIPRTAVARSTPAYDPVKP
jgi:hypothetical protein